MTQCSRRWCRLTRSIFPNNDFETLIVFYRYRSPTGQKVLRDLPAIVGEGMEAGMPRMGKPMDAVSQPMQEHMADALKASAKKPESQGSKAN